MASVLTQDVMIPLSAESRRHGSGTENADVRVELGIWLSGIDSFVRSGPSAFFSGTADNDRGREMGVLHAALLRAAMLNALLLDPRDPAPDRTSLGALASALRNSLLLGSKLAECELDTPTFNAWRAGLAESLGRIDVVRQLISEAESAADKHLPSALQRLTRSQQLDADQAELAVVLPRFGRVLLYLKVVGRMLERDEPLKPAMLIFARVNELVHELTTFINNRLERFHDTDAEMFASLDAASYTASMELKKVYAQELAGVTALRPAPSVYARMETAYALLHDGFQLILAGFAKMVEPSSDMFGVFPEFGVKRERSVVLKRELGELVKTVQSAEADPDPAKVSAMNAAIRQFMQETAQHLFYKDTETVERFVEEIMVTRDSKDLVPLLHRFGAFLDTLLGQVSLRTVLADEQF